jgi:hypothetical protein
MIMAGLLQPEQEMQPAPSEALPPDQEELPVEPEGEAEADESDPSYQRAMQAVKQGLWKDGAADGIQKQMKKGYDKIQAVGNAAYELVSIGYEAADGFPEELLVMFAAEMIEDVVSIAVASGVEFKDEELAKVLQYMIERFVNESGQDSSELSAAMNKITPDMLRKLIAANDEGEPEMQKTEEAA